MSRALAYTVGLGTLALVLAPAWAEPGWDSYPLSSYPMFTQRRERPLLHFVEQVDAHGQRERVPAELIANDEVMQAAASVRRAVHAGPVALAPMCSEIARRLAASTPGSAGRRIEIVSARFDPIRYFAEAPVAEERSVHFACPVEAP